MIGFGLGDNYSGNFSTTQHVDGSRHQGFSNLGNTDAFSYINPVVLSGVLYIGYNFFSGLLKNEPSNPIPLIPNRTISTTKKNLPFFDLPN